MGKLKIIKRYKGEIITNLLFYSYRSCLPWHRDPHGSWGSERGPTLCQGGCVEQLLYATAHAQRMPPMDTLLFPSTMSPGQSLFPIVTGKSISPWIRKDWFTLLVVCIRLSTSLRLCGRCRPNVTISQPKCSGPDSRRILTGEHQQRSWGRKSPRPSEQVNALDIKESS